MEKLHQYLLEHSSAYARWHLNPKHQMVHMVLFVIVAIAAPLSVYYVSSHVSVVQSGASADVVRDPNADLKNATKKTLELSKKLRIAKDADKAPLAESLLQTASSRKTLLKAQLRANPKKFLENALPSDLINQLDQSIEPLLEREVTLEGTLEITVDEFFEEKRSKINYDVKVTDEDDKRYHLYFEGALPNAKTGDTVTVTGVALDDDVAVPVDAKGKAKLTVNASASAVLSASTPPPPQRAVMLAVNFTSNPTQPWTTGQLGATFITNPNSTNKYFIESSRGDVSFTGDVFGWYTINLPNTDCYANLGSWLDAADAAATAAGVQLGNYNRKMYMFNSLPGCPWAGRATIGGNPGFAALQGYNDPSLFAHELGHNLGMYHASSLTCGTRAIDDYSLCTHTEYGDVTDVMGSNWTGYYQVNAPHKVQESWLTSSEILGVTASGVYTVYPHEATNTDTYKALRINKPNTGEAYYISYRQPTGFDATMPAGFANGASVQVFSNTSPSVTRLLDTTPGDGTFVNAALRDGAAFTDTINTITVTQQSHTQSSVTLNVQLQANPVCIPQTPGFTSVPFSQTGAPLDTRVYTFTLINNDVGPCLPATFLLEMAGVPTWPRTLSTNSVTLTPGAQQNIQLSLTPPAGTPDDTYNFTVSAIESSVPLHNTSRNGAYVVYVPPPPPPPVPPSVTLSGVTDGGTLPSKGSVSLKATASSQGGIKTITIAADGKVLKTCSRVTTCSIKWAMNKLSRGQHVITSTATNNMTPPLSATVTATVTKL